MTSKKRMTERIRSFQAANPSSYCYLEDYLEPAIEELRRYCGEGSIKANQLARELDISKSDAEELLNALKGLNLASHESVKASCEFFDFADTCSEELEMALQVVESDEYLAAIA